jgi:hypothetical protein
MYFASQLFRHLFGVGTEGYFLFLNARTCRSRPPHVTCLAAIYLPRKISPLAGDISRRSFGVEISTRMTSWQEGELRAIKL